MCLPKQLPPLFRKPVIGLISAIYRPVSLLLLSCYFANSHLKISSQAVGKMNLHWGQVERIPMTIALSSCYWMIMSLAPPTQSACKIRITRTQAARRSRPLSERRSVAPQRERACAPPPPRAAPYFFSPFT